MNGSSSRCDHVSRADVPLSASPTMPCNNKLHVGRATNGIHVRASGDSMAALPSSLTSTIAVAVRNRRDTQHRALRCRGGQRSVILRASSARPHQCSGSSKIDKRHTAWPPQWCVMGTAGTAKSLPIVMPTPKELRKNAEDCLRLARETDEMYVKMALIELATEFRVMAQHLEPEARPRGASHLRRLRLQAPAVLRLRAEKTRN
jgi:hypothetical protein